MIFWVSTIMVKAMKNQPPWQVMSMEYSFIPHQRLMVHGYGSYKSPDE
jgi:hypothetical protein